MDVQPECLRDYIRNTHEHFEYMADVAPFFDQDDNQIVEEKTLYGDPLGAYKQSSGGWTDTDADRIPDIVESYFSNTTNIENETMWQEYLSNTTTGSLFQNYAWCREYYLDLNANNSSAAENWTQKAFNPFVSYNLPPTIVGYDVHFTKRQSGWTVTVKIDFSYTVRDASGIREIKITIKDKFSSAVLWWSIERFPAGPTEHNGHDSCTVYYSGFGYIFSIEVSNGMNEVTTEHVFNELLGEVVDALAALGEMLLGGLQKAWEAVQNAVNVIWQWIENVVKTILGAFLDPYNNAKDAFIQDIGRKLLKATTPEEFVSTFMNAFSLNYVFIAQSLAIITGITTIISIFGVVISVLSGGLSKLGDIVAKIILPALTRFITSDIGKYTVSFTVGAIISFLLQTFIPGLDWAFDLEVMSGTSIMGFIIIAFQLYEYKKKLKVFPPKWLDEDMEALFFTFVSFGLFGLAEWLKSQGQKILALAIEGITLFLDGLLVIRALIETNTWTDRIGGVIGILDEILDFGVLGYDAVSFGISVSEVTGG